MATTTPWGKSQNTTKHGPGITFYETAGHGGFKVSAKLNEQIHVAFRDPLASFGKHRAKGWYEEDCDAAIVIVSFPGRFTTEQVSAAHLQVAHWRAAAHRVAFPTHYHPNY
jgi:hypothetical protein